MTRFEHQFHEFVANQDLYRPGDKILIAVSGGIDSVSLATLISSNKQNTFALAHCNFQLRGNESEKDQQFVEDLAIQYDCKCFVKKFDTTEYAKSKKISIQMAARDLRYSWFHTLQEHYKFDYVAIAHNRDDVVETILLNLARGTGLKGLTGIALKSEKIIRPLLFASRNEIEDYVKDRKINYREDASNNQVKYKRNLVRHKIIPLFKQLNPAFSETLIQETEIFNAIYNQHTKVIDTVKKDALIREGQHIKIKPEYIQPPKASPYLIFEMLAEFGFNFDQVKDIQKMVSGQPGKIIYSTTHKILKDRNYLLIEPVHPEDREREYTIKENQSIINTPVNLIFTAFPRKAGFSIPRLNYIIAIDAEKLKYPLTLRKWKQGDSFIPLGMKGRKKLSDFFVDRKIDLFEKERTWLLCSNYEIVWIVGYQIDDRYKITESTQKVLQIELKS